MGVTATTRLPAGWYPDPDGGNQRRWWDGREWTQYTAEFQRPSSVEEVAADPEPEVSAPQRRAIAQRIGRLLAGMVHVAPSVKRAHKRRRAHRLSR